MDIKNVLKLGASTVIAAVAAEGAFLGFQALNNDISVIGKCVNPDPVKLTGRGRSRIVTVNPITGSVKNYNGTKKPVGKVNVGFKSPKNVNRI